MSNNYSKWVDESLPDKIERDEVLERVEAIRRVVTGTITTYFDRPVEKVIKDELPGNIFIRNAFLASKSKGTWFNALKIGLPSILKKLAHLEKSISRLPKVMFKEGLTLYQSYLLFNFSRMANVVVLADSYIYYAIYTSLMAAKVDHQLTAPSPAIVEKLKSDSVYFFAVLAKFQIPEAQYVKSIEAVSKDILVSSLGETNQVKPYDSDPMALRFISTSINPFFIVGSWWVDYQHANHLKRQEEKLSVELQLDAIKAGEDQTDPAILERISYSQKRINQLEKEIQKYEEDIRNA